MSEQQNTSTVVLTTEERHWIAARLLDEKRATGDQLARADADADAKYVAYLSGKAQMLGTLVDKLDQAYLRSRRMPDSLDALMTAIEDAEALDSAR